MDDSLEIFDIKLDGPSESESSGLARDIHNASTGTGTGTEPNQQSMDTSAVSDMGTLLQIPQPAFHPASDPPYCNRCSSNHTNAYFSLKCKDCAREFEKASIAQVFSVMRQWSSTVQSNLMFYINKVLYIVGSFWYKFVGQSSLLKNSDIL